MCGVNHNLFSRPGYLIDVKTESLAAPVLFSRMLSHMDEIGLTADQALALLRLNAQYQAELLALRIEFGQTSELVEHKRGRLDDEALASREELLDRRAKLFRAEEALFFRYAALGHNLLSDEQIARIDGVYHAEKDATLDALSESLNGAVGPKFKFVPVM